MSKTDSGENSETERSRSILEMDCKEARLFLLKDESYCTFDLPPYFQFNGLLGGVAKVLGDKKISDFFEKRPSDFEKVNLCILNNKDGKYAWRPMELIHPALYVSLVYRITEEEHWGTITEKFREFKDNGKKDNGRIECLSLPVESLTEEKNTAEQITHWCHEVEQKSIELALDYEFVIQTDITDCYGAIYTHSIAWALHTRQIAKEKQSETSLIGNIIDRHIQWMRYGQTNGIPQGSVLMDFIAEMVLGYADIKLAKEIKEQEIEDSHYKILRYRDDYRIFVNSSQDGERILKSLTEVLIDLGLKLQPAKTKVSHDVIRASIKDDKKSCTTRKQWDKNLLKHLFIIHDHGTAFPNAGSLAKPLIAFYKRVERLEKSDHIFPLISIIVDIAYHNPKHYPACAAILSQLLDILDDEKKKEVVGKIKKRFSQLPNTGHMDIWLQRITYPFDPSLDYEQPLCRLVVGNDEPIWNNEWINSDDLKNALNAHNLVNREHLKDIKSIIGFDEFKLFMYDS